MLSPVSKENELITADFISLLDMRANMHVGDLGCGNLGFFSFSSAKAVGQAGKVYAVDILKPVLEAVAGKAKESSLNNVQTVWSNLEIFGATAIPQDSLDIAFIHNVLFQTEHDEDILKEAHRLLKIGGKLMVIDWLKTDSPLGPPAENRIDQKNVMAYAANAGLKFNQEFAAGPYHFGMIFIK